MKDKIEIFGSPLGMYSLLRGDYIISVLRADGSLDEDRLNRLVAGIANMGANALRDFWWIDSLSAYEKISPLYQKYDGTWEFREQYYRDQRRIAQICNRYGIRYYLSLFDHCGTKKATRAWNPWRFFNDFFYGKDAKSYRHQHIDRVLEAFADLDAGVELCNETKKGQAEFLADTFIYLVKKGFLPERIILGIDYALKEKGGQYESDYRKFRDSVARDLGKQWETWLKTKCISPVHNATEKIIDELWGPDVKPGGTRRIKYSQDGVRNPRPDCETMYRLTKNVLQVKCRAREQGKVHFEVVYGKTKNDPSDSLEGVSRAYNEIWGEFPKNYGKYPEPLPVAMSPNQVIVTHGYRGILGREPDPTGMKGYIEFLDKGGKIERFCQFLFDSFEYFAKRAGLIPDQLSEQLYRGILDREPDFKGHRHTIREIEAGRKVQRAAAMLKSEEFKEKFQ